MTHICGFERSQIFLLPEAVDDYVGVDNPVRFIDAFADELDLAAAGFVRAEAKATGRPGYAPADLLKLYIYGYLNRVRSSRRLEMESHRNIEVIWLLRSLKPDFKTIADFRRDNRAAFRSVFRAFVLLCRQLDLFGRELLAVDGTRLKAVNNKDATLPGTRCKISFAPPMNGWMIIFGGLMRAMSRKAERAAARARKISPIRSRRSARSATATG
jgi:transposase